MTPTPPPPTDFGDKVLRLNQPHIAPLERWRRSVDRPGRPMPHFDPDDGGVDARLLMLLEAPGPRGLEPRFVSRDNPTGTARNITRFMGEAGIDRRATVLWNCVPWIIHAPGAANRAPTRVETQEGLAMLPDFLRLLPCLEAVVMAGRFAGLAAPVLREVRPAATRFAMPHPSAVYINTKPHLASDAVATLRQAAGLIGEFGHQTRA